MSAIKHHLSIVCVLLGVFTGSTMSAHAADIQTIEWNADKAATHQFTLAPAKFAELCGKVEAGDTVAWRFESSQATDFNIHYHAGKKVVEPVSLDKVMQTSGSIAATSTEEYCWMWTNTSKTTPARLEVTLTKATLN
jgi:plastocyanin